MIQNSGLNDSKQPPDSAVQTRNADQSSHRMCSPWEFRCDSALFGCKSPVAGITRCPIRQSFVHHCVHNQVHQQERSRSRLCSLPARRTVTPAWITSADIEAACHVPTRPPKKSLASIDRVRALTLTEGRRVQIRYVGPYDAEGPTLARLHNEFILEHGLTFNDDHHAIYLSDSRRTAPQKLKTILRQPVRTAAPRLWTDHRTRHH